jgi:molybdopterin converting factor small subunit
VGASELKLEANSLNELLHALTERYGSLKQLLFDSEGKLRQYTFLYVNNVIQQDLTRKLNDGDLVLLVPTAAGGRG